MVVEGVQARPLTHIPDLDRLVVRPGHRAPPVGGERAASDPVAVPLEGPLEASRGQRPDLERLVVGGREQLRLVARESDTPHRRRVAFDHRRGALHGCGERGGERGCGEEGGGERGEERGGGVLVLASC